MSWATTLRNSLARACLIGCLRRIEPPRQPSLSGAFERSSRGRRCSVIAIRTEHGGGSKAREAFSTRRGIRVVGVARISRIEKKWRMSGFAQATGSWRVAGGHAHDSTSLTAIGLSPLAKFGQSNDELFQRLAMRKASLRAKSLISTLTLPRRRAGKKAASTATFDGNGGFV